MFAPLKTPLQTSSSKALDIRSFIKSWWAGESRAAHAKVMSTGNLTFANIERSSLDYPRASAINCSSEGSKEVSTSDLSHQSDARGSRLASFPGLSLGKRDRCPQSTQHLNEQARL